MDKRVARNLMVVGCLACLLAVAFLPSAADAGNRYGATGLIRIPTADVLRQGELQFAVRLGDSAVIPSVSYAPLANLEVGVATVNVPQAGTFVPVAKYQVSPETRSEPGLAVGFQDGIYAVLSRQVGAPGVRGHVGFGTGDVTGIFGGLTYVFNPVSVAAADTRYTAPAVMAMAEYDGRRFNLGARLEFASGVRLDLALENLGKAVFGASFRTRY